MKIFWMIVSAVCIVVAAFFLLRGELNTAFVIAALGIVAWFLNYRIQMKAIWQRQICDRATRRRGWGRFR